MTPDASVTGAEILPASDAGSAKSLTVSNIKDFIIEQIEAIAAGSDVVEADSVFILDNGVLKPVDVDVIAQYIIDVVWGKTAETAPDAADVIPLKDGGTTEKTVTLAYLATYVKTAIEADILDISDLDAITSATDTDMILLTRSTTGKKITYANFATSIYGALATYVTALNAATGTNDTDVFYVLQSGLEKKVTLADLASHIGGNISGTGTADTLAQWLNSDTLKPGPSIVTSFTAGTDQQIPTAKAIRDEMNNIVYDATDIGAALVDADAILVDDGNAGTTQRKSTLTRVWTWILTKLAAMTTDIVFDSTHGNVITDRTTGTKYRRYIDNGEPAWEEVV